MTQSNAAQQVFSNTTVDLSKIAHVGFDMDYTLARYRRHAVEQCTYDIMRARLAKSWRLPGLHSRPYIPGFAKRGLVIDTREGNILKITRSGRICRGFHGTVPLSSPEAATFYPRGGIRLWVKRYHWLDTLFALPETFLYAAAIDELRRSNRTEDYGRLFDAVRQIGDTVHSDDSLKGKILASIPVFVEPGGLLACLLAHFRAEAKGTFLLTNSEWNYTDRVMEFLFQDAAREGNWRSFFDHVIVAARKPSFFTGRASFRRRVRSTSGLAAVYEGGSLKALEDILRDTGDAIMYIGDNIYTDIVRAQKISRWHTALIVDELEGEIDGIAHSRAMPRSGPRQSATRADGDAWGSIFREGDELTRFARQAEEYASLYTSRASNFLNYPATHVFRATPHWMPHEKLAVSVLVEQA